MVSSLRGYTKIVKLDIAEFQYYDGKLVAGELGVITGRVYTSYTGYHDEPYAGTVQLILLARYLQEKRFAFFDYGPSTFEFDTYKLRLGAKKMNSEEYFSLFHKANPGSEKIFTGITYDG